MDLWVCPENDLRGPPLNVLGQGVILIQQFLRPFESSLFLHVVASWEGGGSRKCSTHSRGSLSSNMICILTSGNKLRLENLGGPM